MRFVKLLSLLAVASAAVAASAADYITLSGQVKSPDYAKPAVIDVTADKETCCKDGDIVSSKVEVDPKSLGVKNVVVWIRPDSDDKEAAFPVAKISPVLAKYKPVDRVIDQPKCQFEPRILAAREGDTLIIKNSATIAHNSHLIGPDFEVNPTVPAGKAYTLEAPLKADRRPTIVKCDIHPWMEGRIRVFNHPYYAVTDKDGKFEIKEVPVGKWRIVYWHEGGFHNGTKGALGELIVVKADKENGGTMEIKAFDLALPEGTLPKVKAGAVGK